MSTQSLMSPDISPADEPMEASLDESLVADVDLVDDEFPEDEPSTTFADLGASEEVVAALAAKGIVSPFEIQTMVIPDALAGNDILAKSRTGSGKTLAFGVPLVERLAGAPPKPAAVILTPTRELASQVAEEISVIAKARGLKVTAVYGGVGLNEQGRTASRSQIIVATPGRLFDLMGRRMVNLATVQFFVLDEADRLLDMGFKPQVDRIARTVPTDRQTMFFSATLDGEVGRLAEQYTRNPKLHETVSPKETVDEMDHRFVPVTMDNKVTALSDLLTAEQGRALVFVKTKRGADRLVQRLKTHGIKAAAMHGDLTQAARERALASFDAGRVQTLVATDVAARGLDLDCITHVINFDPPEDEKAYVHRVGRTARAGRTGTGITFVLPDQERDVSRIASRLQLKTEFEQEGLKVAPPAPVFQSRRRGRGQPLLGRRPRPRA
ncbi:MAG TPA: DEAD/DEAH box helicase [Actinomycetota bacterium]|nr:DEAD/DEAH box helicase [Actinomycetota bacterium]